MTSSRFRTPGLAAVLVILSAAYLVFLNSMASIRVSDFALMHASARFFWEGKDIYTALPVDALGPLPEEIIQGQTALRPNLNSPATNLLIAPFGLLAYRQAYRLWSAVSLICAASAVVLVASAMGRRDRRLARIPTLGIILPAYFPTFVAFHVGQVSMLLRRQDGLLSRHAAIFPDGSRALTSRCWSPIVFWPSSR